MRGCSSLWGGVSGVQSYTADSLQPLWCFRWITRIVLKWLYHLSLLFICMKNQDNFSDSSTFNQMWLWTFVISDFIKFAKEYSFTTWLAASPKYTTRKMLMLLLMLLCHVPVCLLTFPHLSTHLSSPVCLLTYSYWLELQSHIVRTVSPFTFCHLGLNCRTTLLKLFPDSFMYSTVFEIARNARLDWRCYTVVYLLWKQFRKWQCIY